MSKAGRPRKADYLKLLEGTYRPDRAAKTTITGSGLEELPDPPSRFDQYEKREYRRLGAAALKLGILYEVHLPELEYIAELMADAAKLLMNGKRAKTKLLTVERSSKTGNITSWKSDPYRSEARKLKREALKLWRDFGGSPRTLEELTLNTNEEDSEDWTK